MNVIKQAMIDAKMQVSSGDSMSALDVASLADYAFFKGVSRMDFHYGLAHDPDSILKRVFNVKPSFQPSRIDDKPTVPPIVNTPIVDDPIVEDKPIVDDLGASESDVNDLPENGTAIAADTTDSEEIFDEEVKE